MEESDPYEQQSWIPRDSAELAKLRAEISECPEDLAALEYLLMTRKQTITKTFTSKHYSQMKDNQTGLVYISHDIVVGKSSEPVQTEWDSKWLANVLHQRTQLATVIKEMHIICEDKITDDDMLMQLVKE
jgi:hypothetical protein